MYKFCCLLFTQHLFLQLPDATASGAIHHEDLPSKHQSPWRRRTRLHTSQLEFSIDNLESVDQHSVTADGPVLLHLHGASDWTPSTHRQATVRPSGAPVHVEVRDARLPHSHTHISGRPMTPTKGLAMTAIREGKTSGPAAHTVIK